MSAYEYARAYYEIGFQLRHSAGGTAEQCRRFWNLSDQWLALAGFETAKFWRAKGAEDIAAVRP